MFLTSCSVMDAARILDPNKPSLEVSAQVGKTNNQEKSTVKVESGDKVQQDAESISNDNHYVAETIENVTKSMSAFELVCLVLFAGLAIPSAGQLYTAFKTVVGDFFSAFLIKPIKTVFGLFKGSS